jgi:hypothetical protein
MCFTDPTGLDAQDFYASLANGGDTSYDAYQKAINDGDSSPSGPSESSSAQADYEAALRKYQEQQKAQIDGEGGRWVNGKKHEEKTGFNTYATWYDRVWEKGPEPVMPAEKPSVVASAQGTDVSVAIPQQTAVIAAGETSPTQGLSTPSSTSRPLTVADYFIRSTNKDRGADQFIDAAKSLKQGKVLDAAIFGFTGVLEAVTDEMDDVIQKETGWSPLATMNTLAHAVKLLTYDQVRRHHPWPMYLGGPVKQTLVPLAKSVHDAYHYQLDEFLPRRLGKAYYNSLTGPDRVAMYNRLANFTKAFDTEYGTSLYEAMKAEGCPVP